MKPIYFLLLLTVALCIPFTQALSSVDIITNSGTSSVSGISGNGSPTYYSYWTNATNLQYTNMYYNTSSQYTAIGTTNPSARFTIKENIAANTSQSVLLLDNQQTPASPTVFYNSPLMQFKGTGYKTTNASTLLYDARMGLFINDQTNDVQEFKIQQYSYATSVPEYVDTLVLKADAGGTLGGGTWDVYNFNIQGLINAGQIDGLYFIGMRDNANFLYQHYFYVVDSVVPDTADHTHFLDFRDGDRILTFGGDLTVLGASTIDQDVSTTGKPTFAGSINTAPVRLKGYTVATLPAGTIGDTAYVTDALAPTYNGIVTGGGAVKIRVFYDGTNWRT
jgi:hypothetical protein